MYRPITQTETTAKNATGMPASTFHSAGSVMISAHTTTNSTAPTGVRLWFSRVQSRQPGMARSRENAYVMRDALVTHAMPQNSCPMQEMRITISAAVEESAFSKIASDVPPPSLTASTSVAANVIASSTTQPISAE